MCYIREELPLPSRIDPATGAITCAREPVHRFRVSFETKGVRDDVAVGGPWGRTRRRFGGRKRVWFGGGAGWVAGARAEVARVFGGSQKRPGVIAPKPPPARPLTGPGPSPNLPGHTHTPKTRQNPPKPTPKTAGAGEGLRDRGPPGGVWRQRRPAGHSHQSQRAAGQPAAAVGPRRGRRGPRLQRRRRGGGGGGGGGRRRRRKRRRVRTPRGRQGRLLAVLMQPRPRREARRAQRRGLAAVGRGRGCARSPGGGGGDWREPRPLGVKCCPAGPAPRWRGCSAPPGRRLLISFLLRAGSSTPARPARDRCCLPSRVPLSTRPDLMPSPQRTRASRRATCPAIVWGPLRPSRPPGTLAGPRSSLFRALQRDLCLGCRWLYSSPENLGCASPHPTTTVPLLLLPFPLRVLQYTRAGACTNLGARPGTMRAGRRHGGAPLPTEKHRHKGALRAAPQLGGARAWGARQRRAARFLRHDRGLHKGCNEWWHAWGEWTAARAGRSNAGQNRDDETVRAAEGGRGYRNGAAGAERRRASVPKSHRQGPARAGRKWRHGTMLGA